MRVEVESYSGFKADERPLRFRLGDRSYEVVELLDKWYGPNETWFKVKASDGGLYILKLSAEGEWALASFRTTPSSTTATP
jgi:hypothetical protein